MDEQILSHLVLTEMCYILAGNSVSQLADSFHYQKK